MSEIIVDHERTQPDPLRDAGNRRERRDRRPVVADVIDSVDHIEAGDLCSDSVFEEFACRAGTELTAEPNRALLRRTACRAGSPSREPSGGASYVGSRRRLSPASATEALRSGPLLSRMLIDSSHWRSRTKSHVPSHSASSPTPATTCGGAGVGAPSGLTRTRPVRRRSNERASSDCEPRCNDAPMVVGSPESSRVAV